MPEVSGYGPPNNAVYLRDDGKETGARSTERASENGPTATKRGVEIVLSSDQVRQEAASYDELNRPRNASGINELSASEQRVLDNRKLEQQDRAAEKTDPGTMTETQQRNLDALL